MSVKLSNTSIFMKKQTNFAMKREFEEFDGDEGNKDQMDSNGSSELNSECSDIENGGTGDDAGAALDYTENTLALQPVADFIKKELLPDFDFNPFRNQSLYKDNFQSRSPFLLPTQLYKSFLANLEKRRRNVAECYSLYPRNMLFSNGFNTETDEDNVDGTQDSPDEV